MIFWPIIPGSRSNRDFQKDQLTTATGERVRVNILRADQAAERGPHPERLEESSSYVAAEHGLRLQLIRRGQ